MCLRLSAVGVTGTTEEHSSNTLFLTTQQDKMLLLYEKLGVSIFETILTASNIPGDNLAELPDPRAYVQFQDYAKSPRRHWVPNFAPCEC